MPENTVAKAHRDSSLTSKSKWVTPSSSSSWLAFSSSAWSWVPRRLAAARKASGTDDAAAEAAEKAGAKKWIKPIFEPNSSEVESGLFALQAALGAGIVGYALGRMSGRTKGREEAERASDLNSVDDVPQAAVTSSEDTSTSKS